MTALPSIDFTCIRTHAGTQHRAFEELAYLLAWDLEGLDDGIQIERRATPDGGIEFSCIPAGKGLGGRWAWQAKYLFRFDSSTFRQMTESVMSALDSTPDLERYIFVLPKNRSTGCLILAGRRISLETRTGVSGGRSVNTQRSGSQRNTSGSLSRRCAVTLPIIV